MERVRPVVFVLGSEQYGSLEDQLVSHWGSTFTLQFRSHFKDEVHRPSNIVDLNKSLIPSEDWVKRWTEERPSVIVDVLEQVVDQSAVSLAQAALKASGISYYVLCTSALACPLDCVYPLTALSSLKETTLDSCLSYYKERAKRYRKWVSLKQSRFPVAYGSLVRYNVKAAWMEELAMDLPAAVRAYHVAYSALVEAAKAFKQPEAFIGSVRTIADYLARKIVCGLARSGSAQEADAYLRNHHTWSKSTAMDQITNFLAVAESFSHSSNTRSSSTSDSILIPGHYYLQAINLARSQAQLDLAHLRSMLTLAFDSYKSVNARRHLIYISLLSADLFEHAQNMEMLSQAVRDEKWDCMAALMIRCLTSVTVQAAWFALAHTSCDEERLVGCLESGNGSVQFGNVIDTCHLPCAMRFVHRKDGLRVQVTLCNMSPIVISLDAITLLFKENEEITIHAAEEIIPGATYSVTQSVDGPDRVLRLAQIRLQCGNLCFNYPVSVLCTVETLYLLPMEELTRWNKVFLRSLGHYWERSKVHIPKPAESNAVLTCSATSTLATRVPIKFTFASERPTEGLMDTVQILGCDHGTCEAMAAPFRIDDGPIEITWSTPGTKSILFEGRSETGETRSFCQQFHLVDPFKFSFNLVRCTLDASLLTVDLAVQIDGIVLVKWDLWDSSSGSILSAVNPIPSKEAYMAGDILRAGFMVGPCEDLVFRVGWTTESIAQCTTSEQCPSHLLAKPAGLMLGTHVSSMQARVGERLCIRWTLKSHMDTPSIPLTLTISDQPTDPDHEECWVYEGPCVMDVDVEPGQSCTVEAWITGMRPGRLALPIVTVTPTNPAHVMHPLIAIDHPAILIIN